MENLDIKQVLKEDLSLKLERDKLIFLIEELRRGKLSMAEIIKCCPFCGSHEIEVCRTNPNACWIRCAVCGCDAESNKTRQGAIANWNRRHYDDTPATVVKGMDTE